MTRRDQTQLDQEIVVAKLNRTMIGWANYFYLGPVSMAYRGRLKKIGEAAVDKEKTKKMNSRNPKALPTHGGGPFFAALSAIPLGR